MTRPLWQSALFAMDPEDAHEWALRTLELLGRMPRSRAHLWPPVALDPGLRQRLWGIDFVHPLGLAAGFDKDGRAAPSLAGPGFAFAELGTITPRPQAGNPRPRVFRYPEQGAIINRMGFPGAGADAVAQRLSSQPRPGIPLGINLGKNRDTPLEQAADDYTTVLQTLWAYADYAVVNVSSPNTPGLRGLQDEAQIRPLLAQLATTNQRLAQAHGRSPLPILLKIAPDLTGEALDALGRMALNDPELLAGFIAGNTTLARPSPWPEPSQAGGLSGAPLRARATAVIARLYRASQGQVPIIGVGGIASAPEAMEKLRAGASLLQLYTAWVFATPRLPLQIALGLGEALRDTGHEQLDTLIGADAEQLCQAHRLD